MKYQYALTKVGSSLYADRSDKHYYNLNHEAPWLKAGVLDSWSMDNRIPDTLLRLLGVPLE
jgi:hypothetical protein